MALMDEPLVGMSNALEVLGKFSNETRSMSSKAFDAPEMLASFTSELSADLSSTRNELAELKIALRDGIRSATDIEKLLASPGPKKIIHFVRDGRGQVEGAVVQERK
jgi:hypothetical protein